jgi:hypothetical protein
MLTRHLTKIASGIAHTARPIYYVAGPPAMVKNYLATGCAQEGRAMLTDAGIDDDDIRTEEFGGY